MIDLNPRHARSFHGTAALLSAALPGAGQWWLRYRRRALLLALPALAVAGALIYLGTRGAAGLAALLVQPRWLWVLVGVNAAVVLLRLAAVADAWWLERPAGERLLPSLLSLLPALLVAAALTLPQVIVHRYALDALDLLETVFHEPEDLPPLEDRIAALLAQGLTEEDLGPVITTTTATTTANPPSTGTTVSTTTTTLPREQVLAGALGDTRLTVLLAGGDFGPGRSDLRTDVMILAILDLETHQAGLVGISRDLVQAPLPSAWANADLMRGVQWYHEDQAYQARVARALEAGEEPPPKPPWEYCNCYADRINYLHVHTANWINTFPDAPDPGMEALRQTLEVTLDLPIDYYVLVDFAGFVDLVDALGGVEVNSIEEMSVAFSPAKPGEEPVEVSITPGRHHMDGRTALAYVRNRTGSSDGRRMLRQRCMLRDLAAELDAATLLTRFSPIARAITTSTTSTIPLYLLPDLIEVLADLDTGDIHTAAIGYPAHSRGTNYLGLPIIDVAATRATVADLLASFTTAGSATPGNYTDECG